MEVGAITKPGFGASVNVKTLLLSVAGISGMDQPSLAVATKKTQLRFAQVGIETQTG
jgi:hypothetical protein